MRTYRCGLRRSFLFTSLFFLIYTAGAFGQAHPRVVDAVDNARRVTLPGNVHPLARAEFERGAVDDALPMTRILLLLKRGEDQEAALQNYLGQQQEKSSPNYHVWLTPEQFGAQYGPADADILAVTQWLGNQGFRIERVNSGKTVIEFSGTAGQLRATFGTAIRNYEVNGKTYVANANDPQIPVALAPVVAGVVSLNNFPRQSHVRITGQARKVAGKPGLEPLFTFPNPFGGSGNFYALAPGDFAKIYNSAPLIHASPPVDGTGQTIAIVGETNINVSDVQAFRTLFGLPSTFTSSNVILNGEDPGITSVGEEGEADLDTQWSGAVAPGATVNLVVSASTSTTAGIDLSALYIIENNSAGVMSESYGICEAGLGSAGNVFYNALWEQAAAQGITVVVSAGDNGSAGCDDFTTATMATQGLAVSGIASTPYNVAVGGTDFDQVNNWGTFWSASNTTTGTDVIGTSALGYIPEIPWNQNCAQIGPAGCGPSAPKGSLNVVAGGGGSSNIYGKPSWQMGILGMPADNHRDLPDVSLFASPGFDGSGYIVCQADAYANLPCTITTPGGVNVQIVGGTSASAPAFAGIMALVNQKQATAQNAVPRQGNANYVLYALAKKQGAGCVSGRVEASTCILNDVIKGNSVLPTGSSGIGTNSVPCKGGTPNCSATGATQTGVLVESTSPTTEAWPVSVGYDLATGLGSVNVQNLATNWGSVNTVPTTTTLALSPTQNISHGASENVSVNIIVTPKSGTASGDVSLIASLQGRSGTTTQQGLARFTLGANGSFSGTTQSLPGGSYTVTAHYAGDGTNTPSDSSPPVSVTVTPEGSKTFANLVTLDINGNPTSFAASGATYGSGFAVFRVDVGDAASSLLPATGISRNCSKGSTNCPTGTVALASTGSLLGTSSMALNILGYSETQPLPPGNYSVTANYPGDASYGSSRGSTSFTIAQAPVTLIAGLATPVQLGNFEQITATVNTTSDGAAPSGTCQFFVDGSPIGSSVPINQSIPYTASMNPAYAWAAASSGTSFASVGNHTLTAQYSGDSNYAAATSAPAPFNVTQGLPYFTVYANPNQINVGQQAALVATVRGTATGVTPTGTVTFLNGTTSLSGTVTYSSSAGTLTANIPYSPPAAGTYQINATYSGDTNYLPESTSGPGTLTVIGPDFSLASQPSSATVVAGKAATYTVTISGTNGFNGNVNVTCSLLAAATTCSASPASVASGSTTTLSVTTTAHQSALPWPFVGPLAPGLRSWPISVFFGLALAFLAYKGIARQRKLAASAFLIVPIVFAALAVAGCGGGSGGGASSGPPPAFGTQPGTYTVTITATTATATHTTTVSLTVQ